LELLFWRSASNRLMANSHLRRRRDSTF